jgi:hypothetical protein
MKILPVLAAVRRDIESPLPCDAAHAVLVLNFP